MSKQTWQDFMQQTAICATSSAGKHIQTDTQDTHVWVTQHEGDICPLAAMVMGHWLAGGMGCNRYQHMWHTHTDNTWSCHHFAHSYSSAFLHNFFFLERESEKFRYFPVHLFLFWWHCGLPISFATDTFTSDIILCCFVLRTLLVNYSLSFDFVRTLD